MSDKNTYFYSVNNWGCCHSIETLWDIEEDGEWLAQDAAEDYHENHDGWESSWPLKINLHREDKGEVVATYDIEREYEPTFSATVYNA